jgi:ubiquinone/menaquinone biosynthesis C-methylase UbiE
MIDPVAAQGFQAGAEAYERGRPDYPAQAVDALVKACQIGPGSHVLDLAAGTGKFTRLLVPTQAKLLAVEPVAAMRKKFSSVLPDIEILEGTAESMPVADGWADAIVAAQAFHWFDGAKALAECHRVLRPGGVLGLVWNVRDGSVGWIAEMTRIIDAYEKAAPRYKNFAWKAAFDRSTLFGPLKHQSFAYAYKGSVASVLDRIASVSFIAALPEEQRQTVLERTKEMLAKDPSTAGMTEIETRYVTEIYWCKKL